MVASDALLQVLGDVRTWGLGRSRLRRGAAKRPLLGVCIKPRENPQTAEPGVLLGRENASRERPHRVPIRITDWAFQQEVGQT